LAFTQRISKLSFRKIFTVFEADKDNVLQYKKALSKLYILDLDSLKPLLAGHYSITGAPAKNQPELIRSFILMSQLGYQSITKWVEKLAHNEILCVMIGLSKSEIHKVGSYYDFISHCGYKTVKLNTNSITLYITSKANLLRSFARTRSNHHGIQVLYRNLSI